jgi:hypothetical protein
LKCGCVGFGPFVLHKKEEKKWGKRGGKKICGYVVDFVLVVVGMFFYGYLFNGKFCADIT